MKKIQIINFTTMLLLFGEKLLINIDHGELLTIWNGMLLASVVGCAYLLYKI
ncbi:hypothetical protein M1D30_13635 [Prevotella sp. E15-22]|jgi:hypothetical protein|uniref:hypothetical protein n=1 Tax=Prevotella sp. E15-22 TaxID=2937774 RepID=UPI00206B2450|nr:hypothetical protein [Prevotella sp. E15-22]UPS44571.1 hypothetical protein M1D30_13635 [Prevotella sp. E15-22]